MREAHDHPIYELLISWLDHEQYAFDETSCEVWPPGSWPQREDDGSSDSGDASESSETATRDP